MNSPRIWLRVTDYPSGITQAVRLVGRAKKLHRILPGTNLNTPETMKKNCYSAYKWCAWISCLGILAACPVLSQENDEDEIQELSPFLINSESDVGYVATNTLAGSRLNTRLADTPAAISVFTSEFINDLALSDTFDAVEYGLNTSNDFEETTDVQTGNFLEEDNIRIRIRSLPTGVVARNFFRWNLRSDSYNTERIDFSRGPNSILFGRSGPSGVISASTKQAKFHDIRGLQVQLDDRNRFRTSLDWNQPIIDNKLAVRVNLLYDKHDSWQDIAEYESQRGHLAATWVVAESDTYETILRGELEVSRTEEVRVRPWSVLNGFNSWRDQGSALIPTARGDRPDGVGRTSSRRYLSYIQNPGHQSLMDWEDMARSDGYQTLSDGTWYGGQNLFDFEQFNQELAIWGPGSALDQDYDTYSIYLTQSLWNDLNIELAYNYLDRWDHNTRPINWNSPLRVDPNQQLPDGSPNPNVGKFYVEDQVQYNIRERDQKTFRATIAYNLDFEKFNAGWAGRHTLAFLYQNEDQDYEGKNFREANTTPTSHDWRNSRNRIYRRTYLDFDSPNGQRFHINYQNNPIPAQQVEIWDNGNPQTAVVTPAFFQRGYGKEKESLETMMFALQSSVWNGRIVGTFGWRRDEIELRDTDAIRNSNGEELELDWNDPVTGDGNTKTYGVVFHALDWLSLHYNHSDSFDLQDGDRDIRNNLIPNLTGVTDDFGIRINALDNRIIFTATYFDTAGEGIANLNKGNIRSPIVNMLESDYLLNDTEAQAALADTPGGNSIRDTVDTVATGWEFELLGNVTDNWRISANFSQTDSSTTNRAPLTQDYVSTWEHVWLPVPGDEITDSDGGEQTFDEARAAVYDGLAFETNQNGFRQFGDSEYRVNGTTNYDFSDDSFLKGLSIGGSVRWRSKPPISRFLNPDGSVDMEYSRSEDFYLDLRLAYRMNLLNDKLRWNIQLNVRNLLDETDVLYTRTDVDGTPVRYRFRDPRHILLTNTFSF